MQFFEGVECRHAFFGIEKFSIVIDREFIGELIAIKINLFTSTLLYF